MRRTYRYAAVTKNEDNPPQADRWTFSDSLLDNDSGLFLLPNDLCPKGSRAVLAQVFVLVTLGKHEEESFPDGHGPTALGAIEFCRIELFIHFRCGTSLRAFSWIDKTDVHTM
jgi:hypothetical protein